MTQLAPVVCLLDVDNTLLDNDRIGADLKRHLTQAFGAERQERYWAIFENLRMELGYAITSAPCSVTGPRTHATRISCRSPFTCWTTRLPTACSQARWI
jgi:hypothetical protein